MKTKWYTHPSGNLYAALDHVPEGTAWLVLPDGTCVRPTHGPLRLVEGDRAPPPPSALAHAWIWLAGACERRARQKRQELDAAPAAHRAVRRMVAEWVVELDVTAAYFRAYSTEDMDADADADHETLGEAFGQIAAELEELNGQADARAEEAPYTAVYTRMDTVRWLARKVIPGCPLFDARRPRNYLREEASLLWERLARTREGADGPILRWESIVLRRVR